MNGELFDVPVQLSPRLEWMKRHGIITKYHPPYGSDAGAWTAHAPNRGAYQGETEDGAISAFVKAYGIRLWNEEGL